MLQQQQQALQQHKRNQTYRKGDKRPRVRSTIGVRERATEDTACNSTYQLAASITRTAAMAAPASEELLKGIRSRVLDALAHVGPEGLAHAQLPARVGSVMGQRLTSTMCRDKCLGNSIVAFVQTDPVLRGKVTILNPNTPHVRYVLTSVAGHAPAGAAAAYTAADGAGAGTYRPFQAPPQLSPDAKEALRLALRMKISSVLQEAGADGLMTDALVSRVGLINGHRLQKPTCIALGHPRVLDFIAAEIPNAAITRMGGPLVQYRWAPGQGGVRTAKPGEAAAAAAAAAPSQAAAGARAPRPGYAAGRGQNGTAGGWVSHQHHLPPGHRPPQHWQQQGGRYFDRGGRFPGRGRGGREWVQRPPYEAGRGRWVDRGGRGRGRGGYVPYGQRAGYATTAAGGTEWEEHDESAAAAGANGQWPASPSQGADADAEAEEEVHNILFAVTISSFIRSSYVCDSW
jgi:hypothetical protein